MSFGIFLELKDDSTPSASKGSVSPSSPLILSTQHQPCTRSIQDPAPWIAASKQHTSAGTSDDAQLRVIRALETGVIDVSLVSCDVVLVLCCCLWVGL
jgi:mitotic spindle assembly checkpoint protein MAD2B